LKLPSPKLSARLGDFGLMKNEKRRIRIGGPRLALDCETKGNTRSPLDVMAKYERIITLAPRLTSLQLKMLLSHLDLLLVAAQVLARRKLVFFGHLKRPDVARKIAKRAWRLSMNGPHVDLTVCTCWSGSLRHFRFLFESACKLCRANLLASSI